ncbi:hypothetical protein BGZ95_001328 [Linnemannia exigua]|uniref:Ricin B lectin domain-containing protein n=1 Tax=Linnemannia exigua TaxID=604196 RepID=A0AAD4HA64_9FUNG|nr:hypothetical protein BGZ95_001328 [Linnemannia exigua]
MLRCSILTALVFVQATISTVAALDAGTYIISKKRATGDSTICLDVGTRSGAVISAYNCNEETNPPQWRIDTYPSDNNVVYTFQWDTDVYMTYDKPAADGVEIITGKTRHTFRLEPVGGSNVRFRIIPPLKDGFSVTSGESSTFAYWKPISDTNTDDEWDFLPVVL